MIKTYSVHDHWTDIAKKNDVDIMSVDGVITGIKVNGEDYGGGGGSSDFSTAEVTVVNNTGSSVTFHDFLYINNIDDILSTTFINRGGTNTAVAVLYKGQTSIDYVGNVSVMGNAEADEYGILITGDCTITINPAP